MDTPEYVIEMMLRIDATPTAPATQHLGAAPVPVIT